MANNQFLATDTAILHLCGRSCGMRKRGGARPLGQGDYRGRRNEDLSPNLACAREIESFSYEWETYVRYRDTQLASFLNQ